MSRPPARRDRRGRARSAGKHTLLVGADFSRQRENVSIGSEFSVIDAYAPVYRNFVDPERSDRPRTTR